MNKRPICPNCDFILSRCICESLSSIDNQTELIILQYPSEKKHALNTVRLMIKSFKKISVFSGENFNDSEEFKNIITFNQVALIFPSEHSKTLDDKIINNSKTTHLILIDGPWKKAKKIYFSSNILHNLPCYKLNPSEKSKYIIRSSKFEDSLSTLEASIEALKIIEPVLDTSSLEKSFLKMINDQIEKMGSEILEKNYSKKKSDG